MTGHQRSAHRIFRMILAAVAALACIAPGVEQGRGQNRALDVAAGTTFTVQSQLVQLYATVNDGSRRVGDLQPSDFSLEEDGKRQKIDRVDSGKVPLQIALLLDTSESMRDALPEVQEAARFFVRSLQPQDRVTLIAFNSDIRSVSQLADDPSPVLSAISELRSAGSTRLYDSILFAAKQISGREGRKAIVTFSDGEDTGRSTSLSVVLNAAAGFGYPIYTICAGNGLTKVQLKRVMKEIADVNSARTFSLESAADLKGAFAEIAAELRTAYVISYYTGVPFDGSWHDLSLTVSNPRLKVGARKGFFARAGRAMGLLASIDAPRQLARADTGSPAPPVRDPRAQIAFHELAASPEPPRAIDPSLLQNGAEPRQTDDAPKRVGSNVFRTETRFVEVPVLLEAAAGQGLPDLTEKDFHIYEDGAPREIAFFRKDIREEDLPAARESALKSTRGVLPANASLADPRELVLGRTYVVIDDMSSEAAAFLAARKSAEELIRRQHTAVRPVSLHFTSDNQASVTADESAEQMIARLRKRGLRSDPDLTSNSGIMSIYEAYLIERGDKETRELVELRWASQQRMRYQNDLGEVDGADNPDPTMVQSAVQDLCRRLLAQNSSQISRTLDGLRAVVNAAASDPGTYPKTVVFLSSGFSVGRTSLRSDGSMRFDGIIRSAREHHVRFLTVATSGLETTEPIGIGASGAFMVGNPQLAPILNSHATDWRMDRETPLSQLARETGGRFVHSTNDLVGAATEALGRTGQLYYLGFLSSQPVDGRYHHIRVASSAPARVYARKGYYAGHHRDLTAGFTGDEDLEALLARSETARRSGDISGFAAALRSLVRKVPDNADLWFNLGSALSALKDSEGAVDALQRAFARAPEDKSVGMALSRALVAAGYREAAAETLRSLSQRHPRSVELLVELGRVFEADARVADAFQAYRSVLDVTQSPPLEVYVLLARTSMRLGRRTEALLFIHDYLARGGAAGTVEPWRAELAETR